MSNLLAALLSTLVATNQPLALSNLVLKTTGASIQVEDANNPVENEYQKLLEADDAAQIEVDRWIREAQAFEEKGAGSPKEALALRVERRLEPVRKAYEDFLARNPRHVNARLAYGSFLNDTADGHEAMIQWEKARELDPSNPAAWNNLANHYGHDGPIEKAFEYYEKAIELNPAEPVYLQNLATTTYLFRKDARERYKISESEVFDKALGLYEQALKLDPQNFLLASDLAQSYYGIKPTRVEAALNAWTNVLKLATTDVQKEGVYLHLARFELNSGKFEDALKHLDMVTHEGLQELKTRLIRNLREKKGKSSNERVPSP